MFSSKLFFFQPKKIPFFQLEKTVLLHTENCFFPLSENNIFNREKLSFKPQCIFIFHWDKCAIFQSENVALLLRELLFFNKKKLCSQASSFFPAKENFFFQSEKIVFYTQRIAFFHWEKITFSTARNLVSSHRKWVVFYSNIFSEILLLH